MLIRAFSYLSLTLLLSACGSESESDQKLITKEVTQNVALTSNGATMTATYNQESAAYVGDGDTTTSTFWAGNVAGDHVTVDFGQVAKVSDVTVFTNNTSYSSSNPAVQVQLSLDGQSWKTTMVPSFGGFSDIGCPTWNAGSGKLNCIFSIEERAQYIRITTNSGSVSIYEVEATGTVTASEEEDSTPEEGPNNEDDDLGDNEQSEPDSAFLQGSWLSPCEDYSDNGTVYGQTTYTFENLNASFVNKTYGSSSCEGSALSVLETTADLAIGDDVILASGQTVTRITFDLTGQTLLLNVQEDVTHNNNESYCGYTDWALGVEKDVFACRFGEGLTILDISLVESNNLYLGVVPEGEGYPTELIDTPLTKL